MVSVGFLWERSLFDMEGSLSEQTCFSIELMTTIVFDG